LLPGAVSAAEPPEFSAGFQLEHGRYQVRVQNIGPSILLTVEEGTVRTLKRIAATSYVTRGTATESRLRASFGDLGQISMRFHPSPKRTWVKPDRNCAGAGRYLVRYGNWEGKFRFRGEDDYLSLDVHRVFGKVETVAPACRRGGGQSRRLIRPSQEPALGREVPVLEESWRQGVAAASFVGGSAKDGSAFAATSQEARGSLAIFRAARAEAPPPAFSADSALTRAQLSPPRPFHGTATFTAAPDGTTTWAGQLFVSFPGAPHLALAGDPFKPKLELFPELLIGAIGLFSGSEHRGAGCPKPTPGLEPMIRSSQTRCS
jgi:hypothetical protein